MTIKVDVLLMSEVAGGTAPHAEDGLHVQFHPFAPGAPLPPLPGAIWALVDWVLPQMSGLEACRRLRCHPDTTRAHITMVLENADPDARRRALWTGCDDHIVGPVDRGQLIARIAGRTARERRDDTHSFVAYNGLAVDLGAFQASWRGRPFQLMPIQLRLLRFLLERPGQIFTRAQLIEAVGCETGPLDERTVDVWIGRLRRALKTVGAGAPVRTVRSLGYVLDPRCRPERRSLR